MSGIGVSGFHTYNVEVCIAYRTTLEVIAVNEEDAEEKALKKVAQRDLMDEAQVLCEVQK